MYIQFLKYTPHTAMWYLKLFNQMTSEPSIAIFVHFGLVGELDVHRLALPQL